MSLSVSVRKAQGIFYTPATISRFIVDLTLGRTLGDRRRAIVANRKPLEAYLEELKTIRVLDPACGDGVFLAAAKGALAEEYERVNAARVPCAVLEHGLFGIDLSAEAVESTKCLLPDSNIACGDSTLLDWARDERWREGFDVVIGNPPYIRQELLKHRKDHLRRRYAVYHGMADIFVYFFELGLSVLKPGGRLGFIVTNKWLRAGYAEPLRRVLAKETRLESIIDFGHAPIFPDADTFPCIVTLTKPGGATIAPKEHAISVTSFPRERLTNERDIPSYVASHRYDVPQSRIGAGAWRLLPPLSEALFLKIRGSGTPLAEFAKTKPSCGIKTGYNDAFIIDSAARESILEESPACEGLLKPFVRGQDIERWSPSWRGLWIILLKSSRDNAWPWKDLPEREAEERFARAFPALHRRFKPLEEALRRRADKGHYWWELRSCAYYERFLGPKLIYQEIQFHPAYAVDTSGMFLNNKGFFFPTADRWLLCVLNSPLMWWYTFRYLPHMKDETLSPVAARMEMLPIAQPSEKARAEAERMVPLLIASRAEAREARELERSLAALVNEAYGLTPEEVELMWSTAPPRMPAR